MLALIFGWWLAYIVGIVAVFQSVGSRVMRMVGRPEASQIGIVLAGGAVLGILRYFPVFGSLMWTVAALVGLGSVFATRFGSNQPWLRRQVPTTPPPVVPTDGFVADAAADVEVVEVEVVEAAQVEAVREPQLRLRPLHRLRPPRLPRHQQRAQQKMQTVSQILENKGYELWQ